MLQSSWLSSFGEGLEDVPPRREPVSSRAHWPVSPDVTRFLGTEKVTRVSETSSSLSQEPVKANYADICQLLDDALESRHSLVTPSPATPVFLESAPMLELPILEKHAPSSRVVAPLKPEFASTGFPPPPLAPNHANSKRRARSAGVSRGRSGRSTPTEPLREPMLAARVELNVGEAT